MLYNIKQAGGLKASPMSAWLGLVLFSLFNKQLSTSKVAKQPTDNLLIVLKTFCKPSANYTTSPKPTKYKLNQLPVTLCSNEFHILLSFFLAESVVQWDGWLTRHLSKLIW